MNSKRDISKKRSESSRPKEDNCVILAERWKKREERTGLKKKKKVVSEG